MSKTSACVPSTTSLQETSHKTPDLHKRRGTKESKKIGKRVNKCTGRKELMTRDVQEQTRDPYLTSLVPFGPRTRVRHLLDTLSLSGPPKVTTH